MPSRWLFAPTGALAFVVAMLLGVGVLTGAVAPAPAAVASAPPPSVPVAETNPFLPEGNVNVTDCVSSMPRPECGSDARGGWPQTVIFIVVTLAMIGIIVRIGFALRKRKHAQDAEPSSNYF